MSIESYPNLSVATITLGSTPLPYGATTSTIAGLTANNLTITGTLTANSSTGTSGYILTSTGTGVQWAAAPISLPSQTGNNGYYLTTNGSTASWAPIAVSSDPLPQILMMMGA